MKAAWCWALLCSVLALHAAWAIAYAHGWTRPALALWAAMWTASARGGLAGIEVATRPPATFSNHQPERRAQ